MKPKIKSKKEEFIHVRVSKALKEELIRLKIDISFQVRIALQEAVEAFSQRRKK